MCTGMCNSVAVTSSDVGDAGGDGSAEFDVDGGGGGGCSVSVAGAGWAVLLKYVLLVFEGVRSTEEVGGVNQGVDGARLCLLVRTACLARVGLVIQGSNVNLGVVVFEDEVNVTTPEIVLGGCKSIGTSFVVDGLLARVDLKRFAQYVE